MSKEIKENIDILIRDITKAGFMPKSEARRRIKELLSQQKEEFKKIIQSRLDYCRKQNGLPYCKNCGLSPKTFKAIEEL